MREHLGELGRGYATDLEREQAYGVNPPAVGMISRQRFELGHQGVPGGADERGGLALVEREHHPPFQSRGGRVLTPLAFFRAARFELPRDIATEG